MFNRNDAFSFAIRDPNNPDEVDPINSSIVVDDELYVIKENSIYRIMTADTIDPDRKHLDTKHSYEKIFSIGSTSPYIARVIIQFEEMIKFLSLQKEDQNNLLSYLWQVNKYLLTACEIESFIFTKTTELAPICDRIIEENKRKPSIPAFPQIPDLESNIRIFLNNSKLFLIECFKLLHIFYKMELNDREAAHFNTHLNWARKHLGEDHHISNMISDDLFWIRLISECRNALEHPEKGQEIKFRNMTLLPDNKFSGPSWSYDLTKKLNLKYDFVDLCNDLNVFLHNMLHFFEEFFLLCIRDKLADSAILDLGKIPEQLVNPKCPIKYIVILKEKFIKDNITSASSRPR